VLRLKVEALVAGGLAESTREKYDTGMRAWWRFAEEIGWVERLPVSEELLCMFVAFMLSKVQVTTIRSYLAAIYSWHVDAGIYLPVYTFLKLKRTIKGAEKLVPPRAVRRAAPVTMEAVRRIAAIINPRTFDDVVFMAIATLATAGLFRLGELVAKKVKGPAVLLWCNVAVKGSEVEVLLPKSKTDQLGRDGPVVVAANGTVACPRRWLKAMRKLPGYPKAGPVFVNEKGKLVTREWVIRRLNQFMERVGLYANRYSGHSFRRGGATSLAASGVPDRIISQLGRWRSATYQIYTVATKDQLAQAQMQMALSPCLYGVLASKHREASKGQLDGSM
jgi:integrase